MKLQQQRRVAEEGSRGFRLPKQITNLRTQLQQSDGLALWQNPCNTKRLLSLLVIQAINVHSKV